MTRKKEIGLPGWPELFMIRDPKNSSPDLNNILSPGSNLLAFTFSKLDQAVSFETPSFLSSPTEELT